MKAASFKKPPAAHKWRRGLKGRELGKQEMALRQDDLERHASGVGKAVSDAQAQDAFRTILKWIGEDPKRDGLVETPKRLVRAYREYFAGYEEDPHEILSKTFSEVDGYDEMIVLRGVTFESHCEHHVAPIIGRVWVGYIPDKRVVGISKLARVVEIFSKRLQIQERLTAQIANAVEEVLKPCGVAVVVKAAHHCMIDRGVRKRGADLVTSRMLGVFRDQAQTRQEFLTLVNSDSHE
jgi:GTP cyclohydrolase I